MKEDFIELKTTDNVTIFVKKESVSVLEEVHASTRVEGHVKVYISGFKFAVKGTSEDILNMLD